MLLSVRLMTYNHAEHILECLNSIEQQQTSFDFEVVIGDDFSTDKNTKIIKDFISSSSNKRITYHLLDRIKGDNYDIVRQQKGRLYNFLDIVQHCKGKYIALLDGDDYWTDPLKLQKQVDFLEQHPEFNLCFTRANMLKENQFELHPVPDVDDNGIFKYEDLIEHHNFITTASVVYKNQIEIPDWFCELPYGDLGLYAMLSKSSPIKCLNEVTTVYRIHTEGLWSKTNPFKKLENRLKFNHLIAKAITPEQKTILYIKQKKLISNLSYLKHKTNRFLRIFTRILLQLKYPIK